MTLEEARQHYPGAVDLIYWLDGQEVFELQLELHRQAERKFPGTFGPETLVKMHQSAITDSDYRDLLPQAKHPDFLKYVRAKLGAV